MYALARNCWKYLDRDKRKERIQQIEYDYLAPDSINEMFTALTLMEESVGKAYSLKFNLADENKTPQAIGKELLQIQNPIVDDLEVLIEQCENSKRKVLLSKVNQAYAIFNEIIVYYAVNELLHYTKINSITTINEIMKMMTSANVRKAFQNIGGQLIPKATITQLRKNISEGVINDWDEVHQFYTNEGNAYAYERLMHALAALVEIKNINLSPFHEVQLLPFLDEAIHTKTWMTQNIHDSRAKDYENPFRKMVYDNDKEMEAVMGSLADNTFIRQQKKELNTFIADCLTFKTRLSNVEIH
jgi:hypothetical protein